MASQATTRAVGLEASWHLHDLTEPCFSPFDSPSLSAPELSHQQAFTHPHSVTGSGDTHWELGTQSVMPQRPKGPVFSEDNRHAWCPSSHHTLSVLKAGTWSCSATAQCLAQSVHTIYVSLIMWRNCKQQGETWSMSAKLTFQARVKNLYVLFCSRCWDKYCIKSSGDQDEALPGGIWEVFQRYHRGKFSGKTEVFQGANEHCS